MAILSTIAITTTTTPAQSNITWTATDGVWSDQLNWSPANVPSTAEENAILPASPTVDVHWDRDGFFGSLAVGSGARLTLDEDTEMSLYGGSVVNDGLIVLEPFGNSVSTLIRLQADTLFDGTGSLRLDGYPGSSLGAGNLFRYTNGPDHTIEGSGYISAVLVNEGLVRATQTEGGSLLLLGYRPKYNNAVMRAEAGTVLEFSGSTPTMPVEQGPDGVIESAAGGVVRFDGGVDLIGGRIVGLGQFLATGHRLELEGVEVDAHLEADSASLFASTQTFNCPGRITLVGGSIFVGESTSTTTEMTGGGRLLLDGSRFYSFTADAPTVTIAPDFTVEGTGTIDAYFENNGTVRATPTTIGSARLLLSDEDKRNNASIIAGPGATLAIEADLEQGPQGVLLADGGTIELLRLGQISGGTLRSINGGRLVCAPTSSPSIISRVSIESELEIESGAEVECLFSPLTLAADVILNKTDVSQPAVLRFMHRTVVSGGGRIVLGGGVGASRIESDDRAPYFREGVSIEGSGVIAANLENHGLIRAGPIGLGDGLLRIEGNVDQSLFSGVHGTILADGGVAEIVRTVNDGVLATENGGRILVTGLVAELNDVTLNGDLEVAPGGQANCLASTFVNNGTVTIGDSSASAEANFRFVFSSTAVTGEGRFVLAGLGDRLSEFGAPGDVTLGPGQSVEGVGRFHGGFIVQGRLAPGLSGSAAIGTLDATQGSLTFEPTATLEIDAQSQASADQIDCGTRPITLGGSLTLSPLPGQQFSIGDTWTVVRAGTITGTFDSVVFTDPGSHAGLRLAAEYSATEVTLHIACAGDLNGDGLHDLADLVAFVQGFSAGSAVADLAEPFGTLDLTDITAFIQVFSADCP